MGCNRSFSSLKSSFDPEMGRCRRTDGKKWRCSRDVVPEQKYCERHMHRGAKKFSATSQADIVASVSPVQSSACVPSITIHKREDSKHPNTNLSISTPVDAQLLCNDQDSVPSSSSRSSSSSDATISDTICIWKLYHSTGSSSSYRRHYHQWPVTGCIWKPYHPTGIPVLRIKPMFVPFQVST